MEQRVAYVSFETGLAKVLFKKLHLVKERQFYPKYSRLALHHGLLMVSTLSLTSIKMEMLKYISLGYVTRTLTRMTNQFAIDTESSWSPKGNKILFTSGRSGSPQIYELDLKKIEPKAKRISFEGTYNAKAIYLPNEEGNYLCS